MRGASRPSGIKYLKGKMGVPRWLGKGGPRRARTVDPRIKSPLLYRLSYRPHCTLQISAFYAEKAVTRVIVSEIYRLITRSGGRKSSLK